MASNAATDGDIAWGSCCVEVALVFLLDGARRVLGGDGISTGAVPFEVLLSSGL